YAMHVKGVELVPFEPRSQSNLALGYATAPIGPRYDICEHDWDFDTQVGWDHSLDYARTLGIIERIPMEYLGPKKVRNYKALHTLWSAADALAFCIFAIAPTRVLSLQLMTDMLAAVTGWETSSHELLRFGERRTHLMQLYNRREGIVASSDTLPARFFSDPIDSGDKAGVFLDKTAFDAEIALYYEMMGWDESGTPRVGTLYEHHLEWAIPQLPAKPIVPAVVVTSSAPIDVALASEPVLETPALDTLELQTAEEPLTAPATSAETVSIAADAVDLTVHVDTAPPRTSDVSAEGTASEPATIDAISEEPDVTEPVASSVTASAITEPPVPAEATTVAELPTTDTAVHATVNEHTQQDEPTSELIPPVAPPHIPSAVAGAEEPTAEIAPPPVKKPAQTSTRGNRTPITSALLESLLTTPDPEPTAENLPADAAADVNISAAADDAPTGSLTPELLEQHLADAQAKTQESAKANVSLSQDIPTTDTAASGESAVPQPQTRLPAPAVKPYIPKPSSATALTNPQPLPEDFDFPKAPPPPKPDAAEATPPKPAPRTSIAKRLSIEELLKAELPPSVSSPPREDK
ncbi:MAG: hypothetical protein RLY87_2242, partial [Chloroflexota bacterium]